MGLVWRYSWGVSLIRFISSCTSDRVPSNRLLVWEGQEAKTHSRKWLSDDPPIRRPTYWKSMHRFFRKKTKFSTKLVLKVQRVNNQLKPTNRTKGIAFYILCWFVMEAELPSRATEIICSSRKCVFFLTF